MLPSRVTGTAQSRSTAGAGLCPCLPTPPRCCLQGPPSTRAQCPFPPLSGRRASSGNPPVPLLPPLLLWTYTSVAVALWLRGGFEEERRGLRVVSSLPHWDPNDLVSWGRTERLRAENEGSGRCLDPGLGSPGSWPIIVIAPVPHLRVQVTFVCLLFQPRCWGRGGLDVLWRHQAGEEVARGGGTGAAPH